MRGIGRTTRQTLHDLTATAQFETAFKQENRIGIAVAFLEYVVATSVAHDLSLPQQLGAIAR
jgi:hypothetical protein